MQLTAEIWYHFCNLIIKLAHQLYTYQYPELIEKKKELEEKYNCTVYAITHEITEIGEFYDFLIVTDYKEEWNDLIGTYQGKNFYAMAYVWNKDDDYSIVFFIYSFLHPQLFLLVSTL